MTTCLAGVALAAPEEAQAVIDRHITSCDMCGTNQPCTERLAAEQVFVRYERLPRRTPGLAGAGRFDKPGFGWLTSA